MRAAPAWLEALRRTEEWREAHTARDAAGQVVVPGFDWAGEAPPTVARFVAWLGETYGDRVAIADYTTGRGKRGRREPELVSYRRLRDLVVAGARWLRGLGIGRWDHVAVCLPNSVEVLVLQYAAWCVGALVSPVNLDQRDRIGPILRGADHRLVVVSSDPAAFAADHGLEPGRVVNARTLGGEAATDELSSREGDSLFEPSEGDGTFEPRTSKGTFEPSEGASPDEPVLILYTSGTTGSPKGAMLAPRGLFTGALALQEGFALGADDRFLLVNPLYHINSIAFCLALFGVGARLALPPFAAHWEVALAERITATSMVQRHLTPLLDPSGPADRRNAALFDELVRGGTLRWIAVGSGPLALEVQERLLDRGALILFRWGMSENHLAGTNVRPGHDRAYYRRYVGSTGPTNRYLELYVIDEEGRRHRTGRGRLVQKGSVLVAYSTEEASRGAFAGGVHDTGDVAEITPEGHVYIVGRTKETILRSGENIFPQDVDNALMRHPAIVFAQTVGYPDPDHSEEVGAFVVVADDAPPERELLAYAAALGIQKRPKKLICLGSEHEGAFLRFTGPGKAQRLANQVLFWRAHLLDEATRLMVRDGLLPAGTLGYGVPDGAEVGWLLVVPLASGIRGDEPRAALEAYLGRASRVGDAELRRLLAQRGLEPAHLMPSSVRVLERSTGEIAALAARNRVAAIRAMAARSADVSS